MKSTLRVTLALLLLAALAAFVFREPLARAALERAVAAGSGVAAAHGVVLRRLDYRGPRFNGLMSVTFEQVAADVQLPRGAGSDGERQIAVRAERVGASLEGPWPLAVRLTVAGGAAESTGAPSAARPGQRLSQVQGEIVVPISGWSRGRAMDRMRSEARRIVDEGRMSIPARGSAIATVRIGAALHDLRVRAVPAGRGDGVSVGGRSAAGSARFLIEQEDVARLGPPLGLPMLTPAEVELIAANPARAPALLRITQRATGAALAMQRADPSAPHDAYKHVLWSYLLTREFGAEFSKRVTDAHEDEPTYEVGEAARQMDLRNNAVGRAYADAGVAEADIAARVRVDPAVWR